MPHQITNVIHSLTPENNDLKYQTCYYAAAITKPENKNFGLYRLHIDRIANAGRTKICKVNYNEFIFLLILNSESALMFQQ
jgi:hypothetical protein